MTRLGSDRRAGPRSSASCRRDGVSTRGRMIVQEPYLEITFRRGRPLAAYYYLPRRRGQRSHRTVRAATGILVDYGRDGQPLGLEITAPGKVSLTALNRVLRKLGFPAVERAEVAPLIAA